MRFAREHRFFHSERGPLLRTLVLIAAAIALMVVDHRFQALSGARGVLMTVVYPVQWLVDAPAAAGRNIATDLSSRRQLLGENARLKRELLMDQTELERLDTLKQENRRLRRLLNAVAEMPGRVVAAGILSVDLNPFQNLITLNAGHNLGVHRGQPLLDADGVVGQVTKVGPLDAQAMLITDPASAVPVEIERTGLATLAVGTGHLNALSLPYLPNNTDVKPGDRLITSGLGGRYPRGYPVGEVTGVAPQPGDPFARVEARPLAQLGREHQVLLYFTGKGAHP